MSPELINLYTYADKVFGIFNPEKSDIFSLGISFIRVIN